MWGWFWKVCTVFRKFNKSTVLHLDWLELLTGNIDTLCYNSFSGSLSIVSLWVQFKLPSKNLKQLGFRLIEDQSLSIALALSFKILERTLSLGLTILTEALSADVREGLFNSWSQVVKPLPPWKIMLAPYFLFFHWPKTRAFSTYVNCFWRRNFKRWCFLIFLKCVSNGFKGILSSTF